jgi:hypothetical protein
LSVAHDRPPVHVLSHDARQQLSELLWPVNICREQRRPQTVFAPSAPPEIPRGEREPAGGVTHRQEHRGMRLIPHAELRIQGSQARLEPSDGRP